MPYILDPNADVREIWNLQPERDGFVFANMIRYGLDDLIVRLAPSEIFETAYLAGRAAGKTPGNHLFTDAVDFAKAARDWKGALNDHGHTSYYGVRRIQDMRAYWLGRLRRVREMQVELLREAMND